MKNKEITFLFGSGISYASGMANVKDITDSIRYGSWRRAQDGIFYRKSECTSRKLHVQDFINLIYEKLEFYIKNSKYKFGADKNISYEDIYAVVKQFDELIHNGIENPANLKFFDEIVEDSIDILPYEHGMADFTDLVAETCRFIDWAVYWNLKIQKISMQDIHGFNLLSEIKDRQDIKRVNIFSLNHDTLIEKFLGDACTDGFGLSKNPVRIYDISNYNNSCKFHLYKLHGSIDWRTYFDCSSGTYKTGKSDLGHIEQEICLQHTNYSLRCLSPLILSGALIKEYNYSFGIYYDMFHSFHSLLSKTKTLFVSGYGWNDLGINRRILHWLQYTESPRIVLLYDKEDDKYNRLFKFHIHELKEQNKLFIIPKYFQNCSLNDLEPYI